MATVREHQKQPSNQERRATAAAHFLF